ncbi:MAG TPA: PKD domain-containing protein, partial [Brumimicrobium sp.]|nr:PKD domain-containing protein [Brumimicrobium sp.]
ATQFTDGSTVSNDHTTNSNVAWNWDYTDGNFGTVQNPAYTYLAPGDYDVELTVTTDKGCVESKTVSVTVDELPVASFDFTNVCQNQATLVEDTSIPNATSIAIYDWHIEDSNYSTSTASHIHEYDGFHDITLIVENSNGCRDTTIQEVTVYALPSAYYTSDQVCEDAITTFENNSSVFPVINDVIDEYEWDFGNGSTSTLENPTEAYGIENIYETQLIVTTNYGCKDTASVFVEVYPLPTVDFEATSECLEFTTDFLNLSSISNDNTINTNDSWEWDFDDGTTESVFTASHTYLTPGIYNVELTVTSDRGCVSSAVVPVTVYELPVASFDFTNACDNEDVLLVSTTTANATGNTDYFWDINSDDASDYMTSNVAHTFTHNGFHDVRLIVENSNGCRDTIVEEITVYALPRAGFTVDAVCEDETTNFANSSSVVQVDNDVIDQYEWDFGNGTTSNLENPTVDYTRENIYLAQLNITTNYGCKDSIVLPVSVFPLPLVDFSPTDVCLEFPTHFGDESSVANGNTQNSIVAWDWDFADGNTSTDQNPLHTYIADGVYNSVLTVTTNNNCSSKKTIVVTVHPKPSASFTGIDLEGCAPVCPTVTSTSTINNPSSLVHYKWELSDGTFYEGGTPSFADCIDNTTGNDDYYDVLLTVTSDMGCVDQHLETDYISVYHNPVADYYITPDAPDILDPVVDYHNTSLYADFYKWSIDFYGETSESNPIVEFPADSATYTSTLMAFTDKGCSDTISRDVQILDKLIFYIPNTFTPDGNTFNEIFKPIFTSGFDPQTYSLYIFNRWGETVFESHDTDYGWDGTYGINKTETVSDGVYIWKLDFRKSINDEQKSYTGNINVLR